jgi:hypothetical protein
MRSETLSITTVPIEMLEARVEEYRLELAKRDMQIVRYRLALEEHGIEPPDVDGAELLEMWRGCRQVISTASEFVMRLGTSKELLVDWGHDDR